MAQLRYYKYLFDQDGFIDSSIACQTFTIASVSNVEIKCNVLMIKFYWLQLKNTKMQ